MDKMYFALKITQNTTGKTQIASKNYLLTVRYRYPNKKSAQRSKTRANKLSKCFEPTTKSKSESK